MTLQVVPEGLVAASAAVEALTARLMAANAAAAPLITAVVPPAADPVSLQTAVEFSAHGDEQSALVAEGIDELGRSAAGIAESGASYLAGDIAATASYLAFGSWI